LKAAVASGQPPIAVIFNDPSHKDWTVWDYKLFKAHYILQDWYRDGIPVWWDESDRVTFDVKARVSKSRAAIDRAQEAATSGNKKAVPGRYYVAEPKVIDGGELPTREEWLEEQARKNGVVDNRVSKFGAGPGSKHNIQQGRK
jgi:hypothetical protein